MLHTSIKNKATIYKQVAGSMIMFTATVLGHSVEKSNHFFLLLGNATLKAYIQNKHLKHQLKPV